MKSLFVVVPAASNILLTVTMLAVPLFIMMGVVLLHSGLSEVVSDALALWIGRVPGRLGVLATALGTLFASLSGPGMAMTVMLGSLLIPEMRRKGYSKSRCAGPVLAGGLLAPIMPPTWLGIVMATLAGASVGMTLVALVIPCLILAAFFCAYIVVTAIRHPDEAPKYELAHISWLQRLRSLRHIAPAGVIIFFVIGTVYLGLATPTEAAGLGAMGMLGLTACYRRLGWQTIRKTITTTSSISCMSFMIVIGSQAFSQLLAYTGATRGIVAFATQLDLPPTILLLVMQLIIFLMGTIIDPLSITMITIPMFVPIISAFGLDIVWFCVVSLLNMGLAQITPPFGLTLFALKGVVPEDFSMGDLIRGAVPFFLLGFLVIIILVLLPGIVLLPLRWMG